LQPCAADSEGTGRRRDDIAKQNEGATKAELKKLEGAAWKELSDEEKKPYNAAALDMKQKYDVYMVVSTRVPFHACRPSASRLWLP
jgi:hypothetical protein